MESPSESLHVTSLSSDISPNLGYIPHTVWWRFMDEDGVTPRPSKMTLLEASLWTQETSNWSVIFKSQLLCWNLRTQQQFPNSGMLKAALLFRCLSFGATIKIQSSDPWNENKSKARGIVPLGGTPRGLAPCSSKLRHWFGCLMAGLEVKAAMTKRVEP